MVNRARMPAFGLAAKFRATPYPNYEAIGLRGKETSSFPRVARDLSCSRRIDARARARKTSRESTEAGLPDRR